MSVAYRPVQWNRNKMLYDLVLIAAVVVYVTLYLNVAPMWDDAAKLIDGLALQEMGEAQKCEFGLLPKAECSGESR